MTVLIVKIVEPVYDIICGFSIGLFDLTSWDIIERAQPYSAVTNRCNLCIAEKNFILKTKPSIKKKEEKSFHRAPTERSICYKTFGGLETKNNSTRSEWQSNTPQSYPKSAEDKRQFCPALETPVSYEENLR